MSEVIDRLVVAMNAHHLDAAAGLFHQDYRSEQPAHPGRAFVGRAQMLANWEAMLAGIPNFHAEIRRSVQDGDTTWTEWRPELAQLVRTRIAVEATRPLLHARSQGW
jgi:SnoaL-like domain